MADKAMSNVFTTFGKSGSSSSSSNSSASSGNSRSKGTGRASSREEEEAAADIATFKRMQSRIVDDVGAPSNVGAGTSHSSGATNSFSEAKTQSYNVEAAHSQSDRVAGQGGAHFSMPTGGSTGAQGAVSRSQNQSVGMSSSSIQDSVGSKTSKGVTQAESAGSGAKSGLWGDTGHSSTHGKGETRSTSESETRSSGSVGLSSSSVGYSSSSADYSKGDALSRPLQGENTLEPDFIEPMRNVMGDTGSNGFQSVLAGFGSSISLESLVIPDYESSLKQAILDSQGASTSMADISAAGVSSITEVPPVPNVTSYSQTSVSEDGVTQTKTYERQVGEDGVAQDFVRESARTVEEGPNGETIVKEFSSVTDSAGTMATASMSVTDSGGNVTSSSITAPVATHSYGISEVGPEASHSLTSSVPLDTVLSLNVPLENGPSFVTDANSNISGQLNEALNANLSADDLRDTMQNIVTQALSNYPEHTNVGVMVTLPPEVLNDAEKVGAVAEGIELGGGVPVYVQEASLTGYNLVGAPTANFSSMDFGHEASLILSKEAEAAGHDIPRGVTRQVGDLINSGVVDDHKVIIINEDGSIQASDPQALTQGEADKHLTVGQIKEMAQDMASLTPQHVANLDFMFASQEASHSLSDYASLAGASQLKDIAENGHDLEESLAGLKKAVAEAGAEAGLDVKIDGYEAAKIMQAGSDLARENVEVLDVAKVVVAENGEISISASEAEIPEKAVAIPLDQALEAAGISREELGNREQDQANVQALVQEEKAQEAEAAAELAMME